MNRAVSALFCLSDHSNCLYTYKPWEDLLCRLSPPFAPRALCRFSRFHVGTTITLSHIILATYSLLRRDFSNHRMWGAWVLVAVLLGGPLYPRERLTDMWLNGEFPAWAPID